MLTVVGDSPKTKKRKQRKYSDADKASALLCLDAHGGNLKITAHETGIPYKTLAYWRDGKGCADDVAEIRDKQRQPLARRLEELAHRIIDNMWDGGVSANYQQKAISLAIAVDKSRLIDGQPTSINENRSENAKQIIDRYIAESAKDGVSVTRETAIAELSAIMPDLISDGIN